MERKQLYSCLCLTLALSSYCWALYISLYDLQTAFVFCFLFCTFYFAKLGYVMNYLVSLTVLLYCAACGCFYWEIVTPLLECVRTEGYDTYVKWLEGYCAVVIVLSVFLVARYGFKIVENMFTLVWIACMCVLQGGLVYGIAAGLASYLVEYRIITPALRGSWRVYVVCGRAVFGFSLIGAVYYGLYAHYLRYLAVSIFTILTHLFSISIYLVLYLSSDDYIYSMEISSGKIKDISLIRNQRISKFIRRHSSLPRALQVIFLNLTLRYLREIKGSRILILQDYLYKLRNSQALSGLNKTNCYFLQNCLLSHPNFPLLALLYRYHHYYFRLCERNHSSFLVRLRGMEALLDTRQAKDLALMRELLEGAEAKLMLLWLIGKRDVERIGRLPGVLLQEIIQYIQLSSRNNA